MLGPSSQNPRSATAYNAFRHAGHEKDGVVKSSKRMKSTENGRI